MTAETGVESLLAARKQDWFRTIWDGMTDAEREPIRAKARWEQMSLRAVLIDWPTLAPPGARHLIPEPDRSP